MTRKKDALAELMHKRMFGKPMSSDYVKKTRDKTVGKIEKAMTRRCK